VLSQVSQPGQPLSDLSEDEIVWSNRVNIHKITKNGTVKLGLDVAYSASRLFTHGYKSGLSQTSQDVCR
jgi:hypothetical protein